MGSTIQSKDNDIFAAPKTPKEPKIETHFTNSTTKTIIRFTYQQASSSLNLKDRFGTLVPISRSGNGNTSVRLRYGSEPAGSAGNGLRYGLICEYMVFWLKLQRTRTLVEDSLIWMMKQTTAFALSNTFGVPKFLISCFFF